MSSSYVKRCLVIDIAMRHLGKPYIWGGDDSIEGFDCSGFIVELMTSLGIIPRGRDYTADGLWGLFREYKVEKPRGGVLVFWRSEARSIMSHVEMCITDDLTIGASGGGKFTRTVADAIAHNAFIKVRPIRIGYHGFYDPFLSLPDQ